MTIKNKPDKETLYKLYVVDDLSAVEIAKIYNCDHRIIKTLLIKNKYEPKLCACDCGGYANIGDKFINGHNRRNIKHTDKTRKKQKDSANKRWEDPLEREKASERAKERLIKLWSDPIKREKLINAQIKGWENPLVREKTVERLIRQWKNPIEREKLINAQIKGWENPLVRENASRGQQKRWSDPLEREKARDAANKRWEDSKEHEKISATTQGQNYPDEWTGYADGNRPYLIPSSQCIHLNPWFEGCNQHHIMTGVVINIPADLHKSVWHRMPHDNQKDKNMKEINKLSFKYLLGRL